jgi:hypothetical protein
LPCSEEAEFELPAEFVDAALVVAELLALAVEAALLAVLEAAVLPVFAVLLAVPGDEQAALTSRAAAKPPPINVFFFT